MINEIKVVTSMCRIDVLSGKTDELEREREREIEGTRVNLTNEETPENTYTHRHLLHIFRKFDLDSVEVIAEQ